MNDNRFADSPRDELDDALRQAVNQVRAQPLPAESLRRSLDRARKIAAVHRMPWRGVGKRLLALAALVVLTLFCGELLRQRPDSRSNTVVVLQARADLQPGTPIQETDEMFDRVVVPRSEAPDGYIPADQLQEIMGKRLREQLSAGQRLTTRQVTGIDGMLEKGPRAMWVPVAGDPVGDGLATPGIRVDVIEETEGEAKVVLKDVRLLMIDKKSGFTENPSGTVTAATLQLDTTKEVLDLASARDRGKLRIRPTGEVVATVSGPKPTSERPFEKAPPAKDKSKDPHRPGGQPTSGVTGNTPSTPSPDPKPEPMPAPATPTTAPAATPDASKFDDMNYEKGSRTASTEETRKLVNELSNGWGSMAEIDRLKKIRELAQTLPPEQRAVIQSYYTTLATGKDGADDARRGLLTTLEGLKVRTDLSTRTNATVKKLEQNWGELPEKERAKAVLLISELQKQQTKTEQIHLLYARSAVNADTYKTETEKLKELQQDLEAFTATKVKGKGPQVWHRDQARPTVARVYVGDGNSLELLSMQVSVTIEGPRARTVVDHVFRNPHPRQLEGSFEYPLPTGASASYFAMFAGKTADRVPPRFAQKLAKVPNLPADALARLTPAQLAAESSTDDWGNPMEARIVNKQRALETYEEIVRGRIDPGLLEYAGGNTFSGRVFPIPAKGYSRVIFAYEELLPFTKLGMEYRFPLPNRKMEDLQVGLTCTKAECRTPSFSPDATTRSERAGQLTFTKTWKDAAPTGDIRFAFMPPRREVQMISGRQGENGPMYLYARVRPQLKVEESKPFAEHAVFLLDTSLSEHSDRFDVSMKLLRKILESDTSIKQFNVVTFDVAARWLEPKGWLQNTEKGRTEVTKRLDGVVLEGATNLSAALDKLVNPGFELGTDTPLNVFLLSDAQVTWGDADVASVVGRFESRCKNPIRFHCYRTGLGADNLEAFEALTRRGGGIFQCYGEADLAAAAVAHRHHCFQIERVSLQGGPEASDLLVGGRRSAIYPGGELVVVARASDAGRATLVLEGSYQGQALRKEYGVEFRPTGELAPRGWADVAVASLLSLNDPKLDSLVTAYCQQFGIGSKVASFLILENANDYKRLNLEEERGKTVPGGDLGIFLNETWKKVGAAVTPRVDFVRFLDRIEGKVGLKKGPQGQHVTRLLTLLGDQEFELPEDIREGALLRWSDVPAVYEAGRSRNRQDATVYLTEAKRRSAAKDDAGALRALSSIVEEFPGRSDALRLVGYRLLDMGHPGAAARLFRRVQDSRPFEPHSYRDLARSLEDSGKFGLAAVQYEIVLAGTWHARFHESLKQVTLEEYASMMRQAIRNHMVSRELANHFGERLEQLYKVKTQSDLRITMSWNTDNTDVDLWVVEPDGTKCFYSHPRTKNGGELSQDQTQGYGPERYQVVKALPGTYTIHAHYFRPNQNLIGGETHVNIIVTEFAGTPQERSKRHTVILKQHNEQVEVCRVKFAK